MPAQPTRTITPGGPARAVLVTVWNLGIAGGGLLGGVLLQGWGVMSFPWVVAGLAMLALIATLQTRSTR